MTQEAELAYWINERYRMLQRRLTPADAGNYKYGWHDDPAMGTVRYCNVQREDDRVTRWLAVNWRPLHDAVWEIVLARMINYIPSLEEIVGKVDWHWDLPTIFAILKERRARGDKVFTSAYTISTCGKRMDKLDYVMGVVTACRDIGSVIFIQPTLRATHAKLMEVDGLGSFLAAQVVADLKNTEGHKLQSAPDWWTWSAPGPGSLRGLEAFFGKKITTRHYDQAIMECWQKTWPLVDKSVPVLHMQDFQNCLCEFSKYMKVKYQNGHARNRYSPG
jgi:hypothetical protein